tara:strand:+ start:403 stop:1251 length:849 start_codon:yes stop_codon:yes gene_type:complete
LKNLKLSYLKITNFNQFIFIISLSVFLSFLLNNSNKKCNIKEIKTLEKNSIIIVGHAYGSEEKSKLRDHKNISEKVLNFYKDNEDNIDILIFSGDVLHTPSREKWKNFYLQFKEDKIIYISPGNHDTGDYIKSSRRKIFTDFRHRNQNNTLFPFKFKIDKNLFIIDDSTTINKKPLERIIEITNNLNDNYKNIFIIRHHVLPISLKDYANGNSPILIKEEDFKKLINKNITFIYGDGGAKKNYKGLVCKRIGGIRHILNGIGEKEDDSVIIIKNNKIFKKII